MSTIKEQLKLATAGVVIFILLLGMGCLGPNQRNPETTSVKCSDSLVPGQNMTINETQNNATICAKLNSTVTIRLIDYSRNGWDWVVTASPGLGISDKGVTLYRQVGTPPTTLIEQGIHEWDVTMITSGIQNIKAVLRFPGRESTGSEKTFNLTLVVT